MRVRACAGVYVSACVCVFVCVCELVRSCWCLCVRVVMQSSLLGEGRSPPLGNVRRVVRGLCGDMLRAHHVNQVYIALNIRDGAGRGAHVNSTVAQVP